MGHPVAHSKSPAMHNAAIQALGLPWHYDRLDCKNDLEATFFFKQGMWLALNITMPYKPLAFELASRPSRFAAAVRGANVLVRKNDELYADNTDGRGCVSYLQRCGVTFEDAQVVVCGTGPTSQSIMYAAASAGARSVWLLGRNDAKAQRVLADFCAQLQGEDATRLPKLLHVGSYEQHAHEIEAASILIDATPLGMHEGDPAPFDTRLLHTGQTVLDAVYGHGETALVGAAHAAGCQTYNGGGMLVAQAVLTLYDIRDTLDLPINLESYDLFDIMAQAGGFEGCTVAQFQTDAR